MRHFEYGKSKNLSPSLKQRIINSFQSGIKESEIARRLRLNRCTVCAVIKRYRERGSVENKPRTWIEEEKPSKKPAIWPPVVSMFNNQLTSVSKF